MERKDRLLPPASLPPAVESVRGTEVTRPSPLLDTLRLHLVNMLRSLAGKGGSYSDPGEIMVNAGRLALESRQAGFDDLAKRFDNAFFVCGKKWLKTNGSGNGKSTDNPS